MKYTDNWAAGFPSARMPLGCHLVLSPLVRASGPLGAWAKGGRLVSLCDDKGPTGGPFATGPGPRRGASTPHADLLTTKLGAFLPSPQRKCPEGDCCTSKLSEDSSIGREQGRFPLVGLPFPQLALGAFRPVRFGDGARLGCCPTPKVNIFRRGNMPITLFLIIIQKLLSFKKFMLYSIYVFVQ